MALYLKIFVLVNLVISPGFTLLSQNEPVEANFSIQPWTCALQGSEREFSVGLYLKMFVLVNLVITPSFKLL